MPPKGRGSSGYGRGKCRGDGCNGRAGRGRGRGCGGRRGVGRGGINLVINDDSSRGMLITQHQLLLPDA